MTSFPTSSHPRGSTDSQPSRDGDTPSSPRTRRSEGDHDEDHTGREHSPLLSPTLLRDGSSVSADEDHLRDKKSLGYMILLTISIGGLQIAWAVELSNGSPYLLSLGLSKSLMALVWIAGPLSGTLVQPYVGMLSDSCRLRWGKRRPFMVGGAAATMVSLLLLAWTRELVTGFLGWFGADPASEGVKTTVIVTAVVGVYVLDIAINTVQAAIRAFIVDCAPSHQQEEANSMASRITGFGNIVGYVAGYVELTQYFGWLGDSQFKILCAFASFALGSTVLLSVFTIHERDPRLEGPSTRDRPGVLGFFVQIFQSIKRLPPQIKKVCMVQLFAWVGFFSMLFYTSAYIGELYADPFLVENPNMSPEELDKLYEKATRIGTFALLIHSIVALSTNVLLPIFITPTYDNHAASIAGPGEVSFKDREDGQGRSFLDKLQVPGLTLKRAWFASLVLFSVSMFCTLFVRSVPAATALVGTVGFTWALTLWAPWAIISAEISHRDALLRVQRRGRRERRTNLAERAPSRERWHHEAEDEDEDEEPGEEHDQAGVILGIHNMAIAAPQIIANITSSIIFKIWQKPRGTPGDRSMSYVFALGAVAVLIASTFVAQIHDTAGGLSDAVVVAEEGERGRDA